MSGRLEDAIRIERLINSKLQYLPDYVTDYYTNLAASKEPKTCLEYIRKVDCFLRSITNDPKHYPVTDITEPVLSKFMVQITRKTVDGKIVETSFAHRKTIWSALNSLCTYLYKRRLIPNNPMELIERPNNKDLVTHVTMRLDDFNLVLAKVEEMYWKKEINAIALFRDRLVLLLLMNTGMRETALSQIDLADINIRDQSVIVIDKRHKTLHYRLNDKTFTALLEWIDIRKKYFPNTDNEGVDALFLNLEGKRLTAKGVEVITRKYTLKALGVELSPHKFRASFCTILYEQTHDIEFVRDAVGHSSSTVTQRYLVKSNSARDEAADIMNRLMETATAH